MHLASKGQVDLWWWRLEVAVVPPSRLLSVAGSLECSTLQASAYLCPVSVQVLCSANGMAHDELAAFTQPTAASQRGRGNALCSDSL